ncbi:MAG: hypothetical protein H6695_15625 [Deferribacteres bacterium]|nr:hypothetical protein [candidate division KSB1 bacterium]MCB9511619.1 hypothetical protein [Deferribacteres bacterium]
MQKVDLKLALLLLAISVLSALGCGKQAEQQHADDARAALQARVVYYAIPG